MNIAKAYEVVAPFFGMKEQEILDKFAGLSNKTKIVQSDCTDLRSVFVPGERKDRVLLVCHVDTVWHDSPKVKVGFNGDHALFFSTSREKGVDEEGMPFVDGLGIGADDRAGVAALWTLKDLGHSLLLVNGEEHGCLGSYNLMANEEMASLMQEHQFAIEFDRHGKDDLVFYNVGSKQFIKFCEKETGYSFSNGSYTDICVICEKICGVNISVGYRNEHTPNEVLNLRYWKTTVERAGGLLSKPNLPKFER